jgi:2-octaprenylphenol hydroxylase
MKGMEISDLVIVGGGMVGATLACALRDSGLRIALIESTVPPEVRLEDEVDLRVSAITRASQQIFTALDAWAAMASRRISPFREMHVWDAGGDGAIHFDAADLGEDCLGHIIENRVIQRALWERLHAHGGVKLFCPAEVAGLRRDGVLQEVRLVDGRRVCTRLLIGADGARSRVRQFAGIAACGRSYEQQAVVATVATELPHRETAWQRFLPAGPVAFLPLSDGRSSIVWSTTPMQAQQLLKTDDAAFCRQLGQAFDHKLGHIEHAGPRAGFPLRLQYAERYVRPGLALIGDAAHTVHPLAGQGVNLGLLDAACLAEVLTDAAARGKDIAAEAVLRRYERWRKGHNLMMLATLDGFKRLFGSEWEPLRRVRSAGLSLTDRLTPVKALIMRHAMGRAGDLPALARPLPA